MKLVYTHENKIIVENARNFLDNHGIYTELKNDILCGAAGELAPSETWPELWVEDVVYNRANTLVQQLTQEPTGAPWLCSQCHEENEPTFEICWNCQSERIV